jgi:hypothetical protein
MIQFVLYFIPLIIVAIVIITMWYKGEIETIGELALWILGMVLPVINILISIFVLIYLMDLNRKIIDSILNINIKRNSKKEKE